MEILGKDIIIKYIIPHLQVGSCGKRLETDFTVEIVSAILYRLKTGVQWRFLPVQCFFSSKSLTWQGVYYHFREWIKDGSWTQVWLYSKISGFTLFCTLSVAETYRKASFLKTFYKNHF